MKWIPPAIGAWEKISSSSKVLTRLYARPYRRVIENEIRLGRLGQDDIILNIGCGAVPFTALYLASITGAGIYAMDMDPRAVDLAEKCVAKAGLSNKITVLQGDGAEMFGRPFTASIVALQAAPKNAILNVLQKATAPGARFIFRLPSMPYKHQYDALSTNRPAAASTMQPMRTFDRSVMYLNAA